MQSKYLFAILGLQLLLFSCDNVEDSNTQPNKYTEKDLTPSILANDKCEVAEYCGSLEAVSGFSTIEECVEHFSTYYEEETERKIQEFGDNCISKFYEHEQCDTIMRWEIDCDAVSFDVWEKYCQETQDALTTCLSEGSA